MRNGFTLVELMVTIVVSALLLTSARELVRAVSDVSVRAQREHRAHETEALAGLWLADAIGRVSAGQQGNMPFEGTATALRASSETVVVQGWYEPVPLDLRLSGDTVVLTLGSRNVIIAGGVRTLRLAYLGQLGGPWLDGWRSPASAPVALRLVIGRASGGADTTILGMSDQP